MGNIELKDWLEQLDLSTYLEVFEKNDVDFDILPELTEEHLKELGISLGHRLKLRRAIKQLPPGGPEPVPVDAYQTSTPLFTEVTEANPKGSGIPDNQCRTDGNTTAVENAERRQLTVMFVDLVGSTELSTKLDIEDLREVILAFQKASTHEIKRYDGFISRFMGDGILVYFGWPRAHEDDAERAIRASLAINHSIAKLRSPTGTPLAVRIGIATGLVVVGDLIGEGASEEEAVVGETPNLAARMQGAAAAGQILVSASTRRLVGDLFAFESLGFKSLKGIAEEVEILAVSAERLTLSRFHASRKTDPAPLIGREAEIDQLHKRWQSTIEGEGQTIVLTGEAGIGKSRIVDTKYLQYGTCRYQPRQLER